MVGGAILVECDDVGRAGRRALHVVRAAPGVTRSTTSASSSSPSARSSSTGHLLRERSWSPSGRRRYEGSLPLVTFGARHRRDHRRDHAAARRGDLHPDLPLVARPDARRPAGLPPDLVGPRPLVAADQRRGHGGDLVPARARSPSARWCSTRRSAARRSCSTCSSSRWPRPTTCWWTRAWDRPGRSGTPATSCTWRCSRR